MNNTSEQITALALFSGGLDSLLACRVVAEQGIVVKAIKFVTPFFDYDLLADEDNYRKNKFVSVEKLSPLYLHPKTCQIRKKGSII